MECQIEGDGVLDNFYKLIWEKQEFDTGLRGFLLPDTVIYKHQHPRAWYFTSKQGHVKKKLKEKLNANHIQQVFLKSVSPSGIIASFFHSKDQSREIEYFELEDFIYFLHNRNKNHDGVLQKFVDPKGNKNCTVQMIWTPHLCLFEMRENINDLFDLKYDAYERVITFEKDHHHSQVKPFKGMEIRKFMQEVGEVIVEHFETISLGKVKPSRMVIVFKIDRHSRLWVLMATSIRCKSNVPVDISCNANFPVIVNCNRSSSNSRVPLCIQKKVLCKSCENACEVDRMYEIKYGSIVKKNEDTIPSIIKRNHPKLSFGEYLIYKTDDSFLNRVVLVCDDCYLSYIQNSIQILDLRYPEATKSIKFKRYVTPSGKKSPKPLVTDRTNITSKNAISNYNPAQKISFDLLDRGRLNTHRMIPKKSFPLLPKSNFQRSMNSLLKTVK
jgi:hypothetical protein